MTGPKISEITTADLEAELKRRREEAARIEAETRYQAELLVVENIDALIYLTPHSRTSCSDENPINGIGSASYGARCNRCLLLGVKEQGCWPEGYNITIQIPPA